jgi:hypothetical protein
MNRKNNICAKAANTEPSVKLARECTAREGLPNFFAKCGKSENVKIAYLGGSITEQAGWRIQSQDLLRGIYPETRFDEVFAAIGGTGSHLGVFRLEHDVLRYQPDLLFVEFAVNDACTSDGEILASMEGIVRNTWAALPFCDICFIYTLTDADFILTPLRNGHFYRAVDTMEKLADHYHVPSIFMGMEVVRLEKAGKLVMKDAQAAMQEVAGERLNQTTGIRTNPDGKIPFAADGVHPYLDTGHKLYTESIQRSLPILRQASGKTSSHSPLPKPLTADYVRNVSFFEVGDVHRTGSWEKLDDFAKTLNNESFNKFVSSMWRAEPGASLEFKYQGRSLMLYSLFGPGSGSIEIDIDGQITKQVCFDPYSTWWRLAPCFPGQGSSAIHSVSITVLRDSLDKKTILAQIGNENALETDPDKFRPIDFLIGGIAIEDGEILK